MNSWTKYKRSGTYHRDLKKYRDGILKRASDISNDLKKNFRSSQNIIENNLSSVSSHASPSSDTEEDPSIPSTSEIHPCNLIEASNEYICEMKNKTQFRSTLQKWAIHHQITHIALKDLFIIINFEVDDFLPADPRTLLRTPQNVVCTKIGKDGLYWHQGFKKCLQRLLQKINEPKTISININMDGLPIFNSSKVEFWPIMCNIHEMPQFPPMVIGIFCGTTKCTDLNQFLSPFVDEMKNAMDYGLIINSFPVTVQLRCIICDSPARAYVKGVANFNSHQGCQKCTTVGEYNHISNTNVFPRTICEKRTDIKFRQKLYGAHHKYDSPLLKLDIDMVEQFPVGDSLHLLHLGLMKRLIYGWRDGTFKLSNTKWAARTIEVSAYLRQCKMPAEIHRTVRELDTLAHWKGTEYRTFLHYLGIVALKDHLTNEAYVHFLLLFCAVTICTSSNYFHMLPTARAMILQFIETFSEIYGEHHLTSNVHNLSHLIDEVERFGELDSFSTYPFENALGKIKRLLRNGHSPLLQVAKRIIEDFNCEIESKRSSSFDRNKEVPILSKQNGGENVLDFLKSRNKEEYTCYSKIQLTEFCLGTDQSNRWLLTTGNKICCVVNIIIHKNQHEIELCCTEVKEKDNFFFIPLESKHFNIYCVDQNSLSKNERQKIIALKDVKRKLVSLFYKNMLVFIPLLHTLRT